MNLETIYSCNIHIDDAIEDFVNSNETFPTVTKEENSVCNYCSNKAEYCVSKDK